MVEQIESELKVGITIDSTQVIGQLRDLKNAVGSLFSEPTVMGGGVPIAGAPGAAVGAGIGAIQIQAAQAVLNNPIDQAIAVGGEGGGQVNIQGGHNVIQNYVQLQPGQFVDLDTSTVGDVLKSIRMMAMSGAGAVGNVSPHLMTELMNRISAMERRSDINLDVDTYGNLLGEHEFAPLLRRLYQAFGEGITKSASHTDMAIGLEHRISDVLDLEYMLGYINRRGDQPQREGLGHNLIKEMLYSAVPEVFPSKLVSEEYNIQRETGIDIKGRMDLFIRGGSFEDQSLKEIDVKARNQINRDVVEAQSRYLRSMFEMMLHPETLYGQAYQGRTIMPDLNERNIMMSFITKGTDPEGYLQKFLSPEVFRPIYNAIRDSYLQQFEERLNPEEYAQVQEYFSRPENVFYAYSYNDLIPREELDAILNNDALDLQQKEDAISDKLFEAFRNPQTPEAKEFVQRTIGAQKFGHLFGEENINPDLPPIGAANITEDVDYSSMIKFLMAAAKNQDNGIEAQNILRITKGVFDATLNRDPKLNKKRKEVDKIIRKRAKELGMAPKSLAEAVKKQIYEDTNKLYNWRNKSENSLYGTILNEVKKRAGKYQVPTPSSQRTFVVDRRNRAGVPNPRGDPNTQLPIHTQPEIIEEPEQEPEILEPEVDQLGYLEEDIEDLFDLNDESFSQLQEQIDSIPDTPPPPQIDPLYGNEDVLGMYGEQFNDLIGDRSKFATNMDLRMLLRMAEKTHPSGVKRVTDIDRHGRLVNQLQKPGKGEMMTYNVPGEDTQKYFDKFWSYLSYAQSPATRAIFRRLNRAFTNLQTTQSGMRGFNLEEFLTNPKNEPVEFSEIQNLPFPQLLRALQDLEENPEKYASKLKDVAGFESPTRDPELYEARIKELIEETLNKGNVNKELSQFRKDMNDIDKYMLQIVPASAYAIWDLPES